MKCEVCLQLLEEYLDGELAQRESGEVAAHLVTCQSCASQRAFLVSEQEMFSSYDRDLQVSPLLWERIAEQTTLPVIPVVQESLTTRLRSMFRVPVLGFSVAAVALILIALLVGVVYLQSRQPSNQTSTANSKAPTPQAVPDAPKQVVSPLPDESQPTRPSFVAGVPARKTIRKVFASKRAIDHSDLVSSDLGNKDWDDLDTAKHLEQTENLLRSIRNVQLNDNDQEIDMSYDKALSRRLLNENIVLRRDAEMRAKFPAKTLLSDLEPFLIDIANLPDQAKPEEVRAIKDRVRKTEIVAALIGYDD